MRPTLRLRNASTLHAAANLSGKLTPSAALRERVRRPAYLEKLARPEDLAPLFKNNDNIGWSGFTGVGYPKMTPAAIADHISSNNLQSSPETKKRFNLFVGASCGPEVEERWARLDMIARRYPHQVGKEIAKGINEGRIMFADKHLSMFPQDLTYGYYTLDRPLPPSSPFASSPSHSSSSSSSSPSPLSSTQPQNQNKPRTQYKKPLDWAIIEATAILPDGSIVPGASVGATPEIVQSAERIVVEVNTAVPCLEGLHDVNMSFRPPHRLPYLVTHPADRIGTTSIPVDPDRVVAIVESDRKDNTGVNAPECPGINPPPKTEDSRAIAAHLIAFFSDEVAAGRLPPNLLPLQSGIGNVANSIIGGLADGPFEQVQVWTEVLQDTFIRFFDSGKLSFATATSIRFSPEGFEKFYANWHDYKDRLLLRSQQVANSPEIIRRLGVIAMNTPLEVDIYAHANSTCAMGSRMLNGLGGSGDFLRNAGLSVMHTPSVRPSRLVGGARHGEVDREGISCIVPFASHVDHTEHDLDVVVTEQGLADLRGLAPRERAVRVIENCAHPVYRGVLREYFERAVWECERRGMGHEPHMLKNAFKMHINLAEKGTMKIDKWD